MLPTSTMAWPKCSTGTSIRGTSKSTPVGRDPMTFKVSGPSAEHILSLTSGLGAVLTGRRTFEVAHGWGGNHAWGPAFVLTHHIPAGWPRPDSTVHFVTDGIESAVSQAKAAAAGKSVGVHGADTIQQLLKAGLLDEISVDVAAVLLGSGIRLFDHLAGTPAVLGNPAVTAGVGVTHPLPGPQGVVLPQPACPAATPRMPHNSRRCPRAKTSGRRKWRTCPAPTPRIQGQGPTCPLQDSQGRVKVCVCPVATPQVARESRCWQRASSRCHWDSSTLEGAAAIF
jgi:dihydrofolate reductase